MNEKEQCNNKLVIFRGDIVWAVNPFASGDIQKKGRPYFIISNNANNAHSNILLGIPLTTKPKKPLPTHYRFYMNGRLNTLLAEQIVALDRNNITKYIYTVDDIDLQEIEKRVKIQLGIGD